MRAVVKTDYRRLSERVEKALKKLGYSYLKNQGRNVTEFVVQSPCHFNMTIENQPRQQIGFLIRSGMKVESAVELRRTIGAKEPESELRRCATALVQELQSELPEKSWKGLWDFG